MVREAAWEGIDKPNANWKHIEQKKWLWMKMRELTSLGKSDCNVWIFQISWSQITNWKEFSLSFYLCFLYAQRKNTGPPEFVCQVHISKHFNGQISFGMFSYFFHKPQPV